MTENTKTIEAAKEVVKLLIAHGLTVGEAEGALYEASTILACKAVGPIEREAKARPLSNFIGSEL